VHDKEAGANEESYEQNYYGESNPNYTAKVHAPLLGAYKFVA